MQNKTKTVCRDNKCLSRSSLAPVCVIKHRINCDVKIFAQRICSIPCHPSGNKIDKIYWCGSQKYIFASPTRQWTQLLTRVNPCSRINDEGRKFVNFYVFRDEAKHNFAIDFSPSSLSEWRWKVKTLRIFFCVRWKWGWGGNEALIFKLFQLHSRGAMPSCTCTNCMFWSKGKAFVTSPLFSFSPDPTAIKHDFLISC